MFSNNMLLKISLGLLVIPLFLTLSSVAIHYQDYPVYSETYQELGSYTFESPLREFNKHKWKSTGGQIRAKNAEFIYFSEKDSFQLNRNTYLHNSFPTYFDPYALYWLYKYNKWFDENLDLEQEN